MGIDSESIIYSKESILSCDSKANNGKKIDSWFPWVWFDSALNFADPSKIGLDDSIDATPGTGNRVARGMYDDVIELTKQGLRLHGHILSLRMNYKM